MKHVMVDIETLGSAPGSVILSIGAVEFDLKNTAKNTFYRRINLDSSILSGCTIDPDTVKWWSDQAYDAIHAAFFVPGEVLLCDALPAFGQFVDKNTILWAKGPDFDCVMLKAVYDLLKLPVPWSFRNMRDVRTILTLSGVKQVENRNAHDAKADAINQADAVIRAHEKLGVELE